MQRKDGPRRTVREHGSSRFEGVMPVKALATAPTSLVVIYPGMLATNCYALNVLSEDTSWPIDFFRLMNVSLLLELINTLFISRAITSAVVTIPAAVYLLQSSPENGHGHSHEDEGHGEEHKGEHDEEESEVGATGATIPDLRKSTSEDGEGKEGEAGEDGGENANESESEEKPEGQSDGSGSEGEPQVNTPDTSDDERDQNVAHETDSGGNVEGVQFKGATSGGTREREQGDTRKHIPDAKGGNKKRIESDYGNRLGVVKEDESDNTGDKV